MRNLTVDIGNTCTKVALFEDAEMIISQVLNELDEETLRHWLVQERVQQMIFSSVAQCPEFLQKPFPKVKCFHFNAQTPLPIQLHYKTPDSLGLDRRALAVAAHQRCPEKNCLVISAGSCITYDFVDQNAIYKGGAISPGLEMRFKALNHFTQRLPLLTPQSPEIEVTWCGNDTFSSMQSGVVNGICAEMDAQIHYYREFSPNIFVFLTGGDFFYFEKRLKNTIFALSNMVSIGLNEIINYNQTL